MNMSIGRPIGQPTWWTRTALMAELKRIRPDADLGVPHETPVPGVLGLDVGGNVVYGTADGSHLFAGHLYALESGLVNLTENVVKAGGRFCSPIWTWRT